MNTKPKKHRYSKTLWVSFITALAGLIALFHEPTADWMKSNVEPIVVAIGLVFAALRKITKTPVGLAPMLALSAIMFLPSCSVIGEYADIEVDKSKKKYETETHAYYPASATRAVVNADAINRRIQEGVAKVNKAVVEYAK